MRRSPWSTCSTGWRRANGGCGTADCGASDIRLGVATLASRFMRLLVRCARRGRTARNECLAAILAEVGDGRKRGRHRPKTRLRENAKRNGNQAARRECACIAERLEEAAGAKGRRTRARAQHHL